jgi:hypothetical protein
MIVCKMNCFSKISSKQRLFLKIFHRVSDLQNGALKEGSNTKAILNVTVIRHSGGLTIAWQ